MNEYIIYTTEGYTEAPNENVEIENCQVLGRVSGDNQENALKTFLADNQFILEAGFDTSKFIISQIMTRQQRNDIISLLNYLMKNDSKDKERDNKTFLDIINRLNTI